MENKGLDFEFCRYMKETVFIQISPFLHPGGSCGKKLLWVFPSLFCGNHMRLCASLCLYITSYIYNTTFSSSFMGAGSIYHSRHSMDPTTGHHEVAWMDFSWVLQNQQFSKRWDFGSKIFLSSLWGCYGENLLLWKNLNVSLHVLYLEKAKKQF